jgi:hypothetical protein
MNMETFFSGIPAKTLFVTASLIVSSYSRAGTVIINDTFSDGLLGTNSSGPGGGFFSNSYNQAPVPETGGAAAFTAGGYAVQQMASNVSFNPFQSGATTLSVSYATFAYDPGFDRQWVGFIKDDPATSSDDNFYFASTGPSWAGSRAQGLYLSFAFGGGFGGTEDSTLGSATLHRGNLIAIDENHNLTRLAAWDWASEPTNGFSASLTTTATTYSLSFTGATAGNFEAGGMTGLLTGMGTIPTEGFDAFVYSQVVNPAKGNTLDSLIVTQEGSASVPDPSETALLLGIGLAAVLVSQRSRRNFNTHRV